MKPIPRDIKPPSLTKEQIEKITEIVFLPKQPIKPCDAMFVFGCPNPQIWDVVYDAYTKKLMKTIIISGGYNPSPRIPQKDWTFGVVSEAKVIADKLIELGVPEDIMIRVIPLEKHLRSLKNVVYDHPYENVVNDYELENFEKLEVKEIRDSIHIDNNADILNLFTMTPYYYKTGEKDFEKLKQLNELDTEVEFGIIVYRKS